MRPAHTRMLADIERDEALLAGNKALSLATMLRAGMRVPAGFCLLATAYSDEFVLSPDVRQELTDAYGQIGRGSVAVRSSAVEEDLEEASFAGQLLTVLNVVGDDELIDAVIGCWRSTEAAGSEFYRREMGIDGADRRTAVIVQEMLRPTAAGVLFTQSPWNNEQVVIESAFGLGDRVVSGEVTPDRFVLNRDTLRIVDREVSAHGDLASLTDDDVREIGRIGQEVERLFGGPRDVEWAIQHGEVFLLQARPITGTTVNAECQQLCDQLRDEQIDHLRKLASPQGTVWSRYNLCESLPAPLPMTWSIVSKVLSGNGALGAAYRQFGFVPGEEVAEEPPIDLICGRAYYNLSREPRFYFAEFPLAHDFDELKANPRMAQYPEPRVDVRTAGRRFWSRLPYLAIKMASAEAKIRRQRKTYDKNIVSADYVDHARRERDLDLSDLTSVQVLAKLDEWRETVLVRFATRAFGANILARHAFSRLVAELKKSVPAREAERNAETLVSVLDHDLTARMTHAVDEVARGEMPIERFIELFGHRAADEFELAQPRWREEPDVVAAMVEAARKAPAGEAQDRLARREQVRTELEADLRKSLGRRWRVVEKELLFARRYLPYREAGKHFLMMGYELQRRGLLEIGRRHLESKNASEDDVFYLTIDELPALVAGEDYADRIRDRQRKRAALLRIRLPDVIYSDALEQIGNPPSPKATNLLEGVSVCGGIADGDALVLRRADLGAAALRSGYVLVCPSTDPGWTPLFVHASGLVMERGGVLSHGAIVARELGIPAVVGVENATRIIRTGQRLRVDGDQGTVAIGDDPPGPDVST